MVHSGSTSPMKTTPSASPHLTIPATSPPLQEAPLVPPLGNATDQDFTQTPAKFLTTDFTSNSDLTQPCTQTPSDAEPPVVTPAKELATNASTASSWSCTQTAAQGLVNGRTSGRKRTPKACDCCGPNGPGHNVRTSGRGRARGRGRGRGPSSDLWDTPKRKVGDQLTVLQSLDLTKVEESEDEDDEKADCQSQMAAVSLQDGQITNNPSPEKGDPQKKEDVLIEISGVAGTEWKKGGDVRDEEIKFLGVAGRGAPVVRGRGRLTMRALSASNMEGVIKSGGLAGGVINSKMYTLPQIVFLQRQGPNKDAKMDHDPSSVNSTFGNGVTVDLSDTESEEEAKEDLMIPCEMENRLLSGSQHLGLVSGSGSPQDLDSDMQVDQSPDQTGSLSVPVTLSNGNITSPTNGDLCSALMEVEPYHPATVVPLFQGSITISSMQHRWALRDHRLYCQPQTWEKEEIEEELQRGERETDEEESEEQLVDLIDDFLESFYVKYGSFIPLSENDVLEYLKKKGKFDLSNRELDIQREMRRYRTGLASAPVAGFMVMHNKHTLSLEDLGTLEEQNWLNDQIINMYGELIMEATQHKVHFFNSFFHKQLVAKGYDGVKRWTKKVDLFSKGLLLIPIHLEIHWSLIVVTMATKTISYYDSQGIVFRHTTDNIMKYLLSEAREKKQTAFLKGWKITIIKGIPQQKNDGDCGVFVLEYCRCLSLKQPLLFSQEDMPRIRKRIYKELCDRHING